MIKNKSLQLLIMLKQHQEIAEQFMILFQEQLVTVKDKHKLTHYSIYMDNSLFQLLNQIEQLI